MYSVKQTRRLHNKHAHLVHFELVEAILQDLVVVNHVVLVHSIEVDLCSIKSVSAPFVPFKGLAKVRSVQRWARTGVETRVSRACLLGLERK